MAGQAATYTSTTLPTPAPPGRAILWSFGGVPATGPVVTHVFPTPGNKTVTMTVIDPDGRATRSFVVPVVPNRSPVAQFRFSPTSPFAGQEVLFESQSYDPDGSISSYAWDFDDDGFDDGSAARVVHTFESPGPKTARLRVVDDSGASSVIASETLTVLAAPANKLPVAQFAVSPLRPEVGQQVSLRSFSYDPDGSIVSQRWDVDGDGDFDENYTGKTAFTVFGTAGDRIVRLEVRDSSGGVQTETQTITVRRQRRAKASLINPFPVVRMAGSVYPRGVRVRALEASAPRGAKVTVRCSGTSCPAKKLRKTVRKRVVRFKAMTRFFRAGTTLSVAIRRSGQIGKYTRWRIRGGKLPKRKDLCLYPGKPGGARCPAS